MLRPVSFWSKYDLYVLIGTAIHGLPTENWNGIQNPALDDYGYCHHGLDTFPIWHRPYMAFYEV
jgi:tyrosinase